MYKNKARGSGFTLLEVLLVIALLGILAGFSASSFRNYGKSVEIDLAGKNIIHDLRQMRARAAAGENRRNWGAHFVNGTRDYYELFSTPTDYADAAKIIINTIYLPSTIEFSTPSEGSGLDIIFSSISAATSANFIIINSEDIEKTINITTLGTVY
ncbi:MAG: pilus assembly FimT family protein [Patescibacteria group bacterium]